jgi:hypothetical protein
VIDDAQGDYTIVGWHERIKPITKRIHVWPDRRRRLTSHLALQGGGNGR